MLGHAKNPAWIKIINIKSSVHSALMSHQHKASVIEKLHTDKYQSHKNMMAQTGDKTRPFTGSKDRQTVRREGGKGERGGPVMSDTLAVCVVTCVCMCFDERPSSERSHEHADRPGRLPTLKLPLQSVCRSPADPRRHR